MLLSSKKMAFLGVLLAVNQLFLLATTLFRTNTLLLLACAALVIGVVIFEFGLRSGIVFYFASVILGVILVPDKMFILTYGLVFGLYAIVKYIIEQLARKKNLSIGLELLLKFLYFNGVILIGYFILTTLLLNEFLEMHLVVVIVLGELFCWVYDYIFGWLIHFYVTKIRIHIPFR